MRVAYTYEVYEDELERMGIDLAEWRGRLKTFVESVYFQGGAQLGCKMCFLRCAFARARVRSVVGL